MHSKQKSYLLCIPDTNSLIHLCQTDIEVSRKELWLWLWQEFDVKLSESVMDELNRHQNKTYGGIIKKCSKSIWNYSIQIDRLEQSLLQHFNIELGGRNDQGERHNCCVAFEAIAYGKYRQVIFLTDELHSTTPNGKAFLYKIFKTFPMGHIWSSLDFVVYLYMRHRKRFPIETAKLLIKDINNLVGGKEDIIRDRLKKYNNKLMKIDISLSKLPSI